MVGSVLWAIQLPPLLPFRIEGHQGCSISSTWMSYPGRTPHLSSPTITSPLRWYLETRICQALLTELTPAGDQPSTGTTLCHFHPPSRLPHQGPLFSPRLQRALWWPVMYRGIQEFVRACPECTRTKEPNLSQLSHIPLPLPARGPRNVALSTWIIKGFTSVITWPDQNHLVISHQSVFLHSCGMCLSIAGS